MLNKLTRITTAKSGRFSSWATDGRNGDSWQIGPGESRVLADIEGCGRITHIWMTQRNHYRECLLKFTWDNADKPSILVPLGDFFCLGHGIVSSFESEPFTASTAPARANQFDQGCAVNCYLPMPFKERAVVELVNQSDEVHGQYFYIDYELDDCPQPADTGYLHAEFRRSNPFGGWGHEVLVNRPEANIVNIEEEAWNNNYVILDTRGRGHYIGCNLSVTNFQGTWWGEGDDMIWVDGYKWPPDLHGTGSEDYLNQAWGMQPNAFGHNGSSVYEHNTGGYQTSYVFHLENPVRFTKEIKATIEHGHGNHLRNEMSSTAYWYASEPCPAIDPPDVSRRLPVLKDDDGNWVLDEARQCPGREIGLNDEMRAMKKQWADKQQGG